MQIHVYREGLADGNPVRFLLLGSKIQYEYDSIVALGTVRFCCHS